MFEMLDAVGLEKHHEDQSPQAQDEAIRRVPVFLLWFLNRRRGEAGKVRWGVGGGKAERSGVRLQVSNSVYISPVEATADCSVIHAGRQAQNCTHTLALSLHALLCTRSAVSHTQTRKGLHKKSRW